MGDGGCYTDCSRPPSQLRSRIAAAEPLDSVFKFELEAVWQAMDTQRLARGLSWAAAVREINRLHEGVVWKHKIATTSISKLGQNKSGIAEGDGVLQMLLWLGRSPESFVQPQLRGFHDEPSYRLPSPSKGKILRWDTRKLHAALDRKRRAEGGDWHGVAAQVGDSFTAGALTRLAKGGRVSFPSVMVLMLWLDSPAAGFVTTNPHPTEI